MNRPAVFQVGGTLYWVIQTRNPDTQVLKDADSTPTVAVRKNGASVGDSVTITKRSATTGIYDCSYNPAAEMEGDSFTLEESATVTGTTTSQATYTATWNARVVAVERGTDGGMLSYTQPTGFLAASFPSDPADQSLIVAATDALATLIGDVPTNAELATALGTADDATLAAIAAEAVKTAAIQGKTDQLTFTTANKVDSTAALDSADKATLVDLIWDEPLTGATHNVATSSGKRLRQTTAFQQIDSTVIDASATTTTFVTGLTSSVDNFYNDSMLVFTDGALAGQVRAIYDYIGATKTIVLEEALTSAPVDGVAFAIVSLHIHPVSQIQSGLATAAALATESTKINRIEAVATGTVTGAGTSTEVFVGPSATLTITVDSSGNRSAVVVT